MNLTTFEWTNYKFPDNEAFIEITTSSCVSFIYVKHIRNEVDRLTIDVEHG